MILIYLLSRDQLFFIAFGREWAENIKPASLVQRVRTDPHSPNEFRVQGTLANVPEFAKAFNCPVGSKVSYPTFRPDENIINVQCA